MACPQHFAPVGEECSEASYQAEQARRRADQEATEAAKRAKRSESLAAYERGNAEVSLEFARSAGDEELSEKLLKFISAYDAGQEALLSNNGTVAIRELAKALAFDEQISSGWGKYGPEIRKLLSNLYFLVGNQFEAKGDERAKAAYAASVKYDPTNSKATSALAQLSRASLTQVAISSADKTTVGVNEDDLATRKYFVVTEQSEVGRTEYDIDLYINGKLVRTLRSGEEQIVFDITKRFMPGENSVLLHARKVLDRKAQPKSTRAEHFFRVIIGKGSSTAEHVTIETQLVVFERTAAESNDVRKEFRVTTPLKR